MGDMRDYEYFLMVNRVFEVVVGHETNRLLNHSYQVTMPIPEGSSTQQNVAMILAVFVEAANFF